MRSSRQLSALEQKAEETMSPEDWAVLLADEIASCDTLGELVQKQARGRSAKVRPEDIFLNLGQKAGDHDGCLKNAFLYRKAVVLAGTANRDLAQWLERDNLELVIAELRTDILTHHRSCASPRTHGGHKEEGSVSYTAAFLMQELVENHLPRLKTYEMAVEQISNKYFRGHGFLVRNIPLLLKEMQRRYAGVVARLQKLADDDCGADVDMAPMIEAWKDDLLSSWEKGADCDAHGLIYRNAAKQREHLQWLAHRVSEAQDREPPSSVEAPIRTC